MNILWKIGVEFIIMVKLFFQLIIRLKKCQIRNAPSIIKSLKKRPPGSRRFEIGNIIASVAENVLLYFA